MKKGLLLTSLVLLFACLGMYAHGGGADPVFLKNAGLVGIGGFGTLIVGILYPKY